MKSKVLFYISILLINIFSLNQCSSTQSADTSALKDGAGQVILLYTTDSCECILKACEEVRKKLSLIIADFTNKNKISLKYTSLNYVCEPAQSDKLMKKYNLCFFPAVILLNNKNEMLYANPFEFEEDKFKEKMNTLINKRD